MKAMMVSNPGLRRFLAAATAGLLMSAAFAPVSHAQTPAAETPTPTVALPDFTSIIEKADPAVVNIRTTATVPIRGVGPGGNDPAELFRWFFGPDFQPPGQQSPNPRQRPQPQQPEERTVPRGVGSGFFISDDGYIMTNNHVVSDATDIYVTLTDGREFKAKVIGTDERTDVALIKIEAKDMTPLVIGDPKKLKKGQWVLAIGSPFGLDSTVTSGIVSAIGRDTGEYLPFIQTDVAVNPGNSGGPLINLAGEVVGINSQIISRSGGFMGISLAIPIDEAMRVVDQLRATGKVTRGRVGVQIGEVGKDVAEAIGLKYQRKILRLLARMIRDPAEIEDVAQEAFIKAYRALPQFRGESAFYTWLYRIAINTARNWLASQGRRPSAPNAIETEDGETFNETDNLTDISTPESMVASREIAETVNAAIEELPEELRTAIVLREIEGMSYEDIAQSMDCPIGTVRSRIFRAREAIATKLRPLLGTDAERRW
ncbi:MAG: RNA polymerase sigma factor RpoE [Achromobacter sp.]|nr:RNA polymerase sigma factor RpoE [Achromobacter sp.]